MGCSCLLRLEDLVAVTLSAGSLLQCGFLLVLTMYSYPSEILQLGSTWQATLILGPFYNSISLFFLNFYGFLVFFWLILTMAIQCFFLSWLQVIELGRCL